MKNGIKFLWKQFTSCINQYLGELMLQLPQEAEIIFFSFFKMFPLICPPPVVVNVYELMCIDYNNLLFDHFHQVYIDYIFNDLISILILSSQKFTSNIKHYQKCILDWNDYLKVKYSIAF